ncbi:polysaccharide lyase family 7 protein [Mucilaginibacter sp. PAMB04274]|uniref:polysaccharide lyase family 7 protein n=1 Tax=Mucilaginibacter sp. PAMB04274 TaxID=3138568 RepID=UPI0031F6DD3F
MKIYICALGILLSALTCSKYAVQPTRNAYSPQGPAPENAKLPGEVLNLTNWKLTLPINTDASVNPDEIKQPVLNTYSNPDYFFTSKANNAVAFRANAGGATTSGSNFPRSELREMTDGGKKPAAWSSAEGTHTLFIDQRITHLPDVRKHMVVGQIHDANKYVIFFRIEDKKLLVSVNGGAREVLDENYILGTRFTVKMVVNNNTVKCYYNDLLKSTFDIVFNDAYFKAGAYVQSSCKGSKKTDGESCNAYGEVEIYNVWVKHEGIKTAETR